MKKALALVLSLAMCASLLVGCGQKDGGSTSTGEAGSVYYLNFKPEAEAAWQDLAKTYTAETGVEVKVVTAASGDYNNTLTAEMAVTTLTSTPVSAV